MDPIFTESKHIQNLVNDMKAPAQKKPRFVNLSEINPNLTLPTPNNLMASQHAVKQVFNELKTLKRKEKTTQTTNRSIKSITSQSHFQKNLDLGRKAVNFVASYNMLSANRPVELSKLNSIKNNNPDYYKQLKSIYHTFHTASHQTKTGEQQLILFKKLATLLQSFSEQHSAGKSFEKAGLALAFISKEAPTNPIALVALQQFSEEEFDSLLINSEKIQINLEAETQEIKFSARAAITNQFQHKETILATRDPEHYLVVIGKNSENINLNDATTWTDDLIICDPWAKRTYSIFELEEEMKLLHSLSLGQTKLRVVQTYPQG